MNEKVTLTAAPAAEAHSPDSLLRRELRHLLPHGFFRRSPYRLVYLLLGLATLGCQLAATRLVLEGRITQWWYGITLALASYCYPYFTFTLHELEHGAILRSGYVRTLVSWLTAFWVPFQPKFWRCMHQHHHVHSNQKEDSHRLRSLDHQDFGSRFLDFRFANALSYLVAPFAVQVLYGYCLIQFFRGVVVYRVGKVGVLVALLLHAAALAGFVFLIGWQVALFGWVPTFILGTAFMNGYMVTQHLSRPMAPDADSLKTATSVWLARGWSHMGIGRHVEHHMFPTVPANRLAAVGALLRERFGSRFKEKPLHAALYEIFTLPSYYYAPDVLTDRKGITRRRID